MHTVDLTKNFKQIYDSMEASGHKPTTVAKFMGYTTTAQLNAVLDGKSLLSTKAVIALIENLNINPLYLFLGIGEMQLNEKRDDEYQKLLTDYNELLKVNSTLSQRIQELEKSNADLLEMSSAAIKYYKSKYEGDSKNQIENKQ